MERPIRLLLVEDNQVFREGLELVLGLESEIAIVGMAEDGVEGVDLAGELRPDVALIDYRLPLLDGVATTAAVRTASPGTAVIGLTASDDPRERRALSEAGAVDCLSKDEDLAEIVASIRKAAWS